MSDWCDGKVVIKPGLLDMMLEPGGKLGQYHSTGANDFRMSTVDNSTVELVDGQITVVGDSFTEVTWRWEESYSCDYLEENLETLIKEVRHIQPDSTFEGSFTVREDPDDRADVLPSLYRIRVEGVEVIRERPTLVWPNGDEEKLS